MRAGKRASADMALGRWIRENPGKPFAIAAAEGMYHYKGNFTSYADINQAQIKQEGIRQMFTYDEAADITPEMIEFLLGKSKP